MLIVSNLFFRRILFNFCDFFMSFIMPKFNRKSCLNFFFWIFISRSLFFKIFDLFIISMVWISLVRFRFFRISNYQSLPLLVEEYHYNLFLLQEPILECFNLKIIKKVFFCVSFMICLLSFLSLVFMFFFMTCVCPLDFCFFQKPSILLLQNELLK